MQAPALLESLARRAAISAVAGLLVAAFAAAALAVGTAASADRVAVGRTLSGSLEPVFSAFVGAGLLAGLVVFACLVASDVLRDIGPWLIAGRRALLGPFRAFIWLVAVAALAIVAALQFVARTTVVVETIWLVRTVGIALGSILAWATVVGGSVLLFVGLIAIGLVSIGEGTRMIVAMLDDPPRPLPMALGLGGATVVMYIGLAALALSGWFAYRVTRAGLRYAAGEGPSRRGSVSALEQAR
jgi:hypothetical protein